MKYFKNTELAKLYHVSEKTIRNWMTSAQEGKLELQLHTHNGKMHIANTVKNNGIIEKLVAKGQKYKNSRGRQVARPKSEFYEVYRPEQIVDIITNLMIYKEMPTQYTYVDGGAAFWDRYATWLSEQSTPNILNQTIVLLNEAAESIDRFIDGHKKVNIVDIGPGNGLPVRSTLTRLQDQGVLNRYIGIDTSKALLDILESNIRSWFNGKIRFEPYVHDFSKQNFDHIFLHDYTGDDADLPLNIVLFLGNTLNNFRLPDQILANISTSMGADDILVYSGFLDTNGNRRYFDFNSNSTHKKYRSELIFELLGLNDEQYDIQFRYDEVSRSRTLSLLPKLDITIEFAMPRGTRRVELYKNEPIVIWRGRHQNAMELVSQFDKNGFGMVQASLTRDQHYILLSTKIKTGP